MKREAQHRNEGPDATQKVPLSWLAFVPVGEIVHMKVPTFDR